MDAYLGQEKNFCFLFQNFDFLIDKDQKSKFKKEMTCVTSKIQLRSVLSLEAIDRIQRFTMPLGPWKLNIFFLVGPQGSPVPF